jgi:hypothetical protein
MVYAAASSAGAVGGRDMPLLIGFVLTLASMGTQLRPPRNAIAQRIANALGGAAYLAAIGLLVYGLWPNKSIRTSVVIVAAVALTGGGWWLGRKSANPTPARLESLPKPTPTPPPPTPTQELKVDKPVFGATVDPDVSPYAADIQLTVSTPRQSKQFVCAVFDTEWRLTSRRCWNTERLPQHLPNKSDASASYPADFDGAPSKPLKDGWYTAVWWLIDDEDGLVLLGSKNFYIWKGGLRQ